MHEKIEFFKFRTLPSAYITKEEGGFKPWWNGCGIAPTRPTLNAARQDIYVFVRNRLAGLIDESESHLQDLKNEAARLANNDIFDLGKFKV